VLQKAIVDPNMVTDLIAVVGGAIISHGLKRKYHMPKVCSWIPTIMSRIAMASCQ
jgi:hypothetical protein